MAGYYAMLQQAPAAAASVQSGLGDIARAVAQAKQRRDDKAEHNDRLKWEREQAAAERSADREAAALKERDAARTSSANRERYFAQLLQARPQDAGQISQAARAQGIDIGSIVTPETMQQAQGVGIEIEDAVTPDQAAMDLGGRASSVLGSPKPDETRRAGSLEEKLAQEGLVPGSREWHARARQLNNPSSGVNINMGGKPLPVEAVGQMSDAEAASSEVDNLWAAYGSIAPKTESEAMWARAQARIPGTAQYQYVKEAEAVAQMYGLTREGGKLQASDFPRYLDQMPMPWDLQESANRKHSVAKRLLGSQVAERRKGYSDAGYKSAAAGQGEATPTVTNPTNEQIDAALAVGGQ